MLGIAFLTLHLLTLPSDPASIDAVNFVLGLHEYRVVDHQPHPPGAPVFMALGRLSNGLVMRFLAGEPVQAGVWALAIWGVLLGAAATIPLFIFFKRLEGNARRATIATALTLTCPLFWFNASRPMSDVTGLVAAVMVQALLATVVRPSRSDERSVRLLQFGAFGAGLVIGIRAQSLWLTVPLLVCAAAYVRSRPRDLTRVAAAFSIGVIAWLVPVIVVSGGPGPYLMAFSAQASDDWTNADLLATRPTIQRAVQGVIYTFAYPWAEPLLAAIVLALGVVGLGVMLARSRGALLVLALAAAPYGIFHLLFQENVHTRYALPLIPAVAYLAVRGVDALDARRMPSLVAGLCLAGVLIVSPWLAAHARTRGPVFRVLDDLREASRDTATPVVGMHHAVARMLRGQELPMRVLSQPRPRYEWLGLVEHWQRSSDTPVWFLAEAGRADLALIDPRSRRLMASYPWTFPRKFAMSRVPATDLEWYELRPPGWMVREGWSLSHESAGVASERGANIARHPIQALLRSRAEASVLMVGGRVLSAPAGSPVRLTLQLDGAPLATWDQEPAAGSFLRMLQLPAGRLDKPRPYIPLDIQAVAVGRPDAQDLDVRIDQFDFQSENTIVSGFHAGWHQSEFDGAAPRPWRWSDASADLLVHAPGKDLMLRLVAEIPLEHLRGSPQVSVRAGRHLCGSLVVLDSHVDFTARIPARALAEAAGVITIATDRTFVPDRAMHNGDRRQLGIRAYMVDLREDPEPSAKADDSRRPNRERVHGG
jgi:hypothetical protein